VGVFPPCTFWGPRNDRLTPVLVFDQFEEIFTLGNRRLKDTEMRSSWRTLRRTVFRRPCGKGRRPPANGRRSEAGTPNYKIVLRCAKISCGGSIPAAHSSRHQCATASRWVRSTRRAVARSFRNAGKEWITDEVAQDIIEAVISSRRGEGLDNAAEEVEPAYSST